MTGAAFGKFGRAPVTCNIKDDISRLSCVSWDRWAAATHAPPARVRMPERRSGCRVSGSHRSPRPGWLVLAQDAHPRPRNGDFLAQARVRFLPFVYHGLLVVTRRVVDQHQS